MSGKQLLHRIFILLLSLIMLLSCFSGCAYGTDSLTKPQPAVHTPKGTEVTLHVLTEVSEDPGMMSDLIEEMAEKYSEEHENVSIEIEFLPDKDHLEERSIRLEQLKTEIMAGKGPDIYLLPTTVYTLEMLFNDLELSMRNGMFHEISAYYDSDHELNKEELNTAVMDAGTYGNARYILPLRYDFPVLLVDEEKLQSYGLTLDDISTTEKLMNTILEKQNTILANSVYLRSLQLDYFFQNLLIIRITKSW